MYKVHFSDKPDMCYLVTPTQVLEAGVGIQSLLSVGRRVQSSETLKDIDMTYSIPFPDAIRARMTPSYFNDKM